MRNPGSRELRRRQARLESQQRGQVRERTQAPKREETMRRGGLLEGMAPKAVTRLTLLSALATVIVLAAAVFGLLVEIHIHDLFLGIVVLVIAVAMGGVVASITAPAMRAAMKDRKVPARNVQGQMVGASPISPTPGLATVAINVGRNIEQFRVRPELFEKTKGGATVIGLSVTPTLNYVQTLAVIRRDRTAVMTEPPVSRAVRISVWLPLVSIGSLVLAMGLGCLVGALLPLGDGIAHPLVTLLLALLLVGLVSLASRWYGKRLVAQLGMAQ